MKIAIVGYGYWGPNLLRNFAANPKVEVGCVVDLNPERLKAVSKNYPSIRTTSDFKTVTADPSIDAIVIATPVNSHFELAKSARLAGKHVLVEKPLTNSVAACDELINISKKMGKLLMVDHTYLYTPAVQRVKQMVDEGGLGQIQYFDSTRINLGLFQRDVNVLWDLATHDISILNYLVSERPQSVQAIGASHTTMNLENIGYLVLKYPSGLIAHFNCSWVSPVKVRHILIGGSKKMILFNDLEPTEKLKIYDTGFELRSTEQRNSLLIDYRVGDVYIPKLDNREALAKMAEDFVLSIASGVAPVSTLENARQVVSILVSAQKSIQSGGSEISLEN